jgi:threonine/homoserine/homoserine lactone efflux protein
MFEVTWLLFIVASLVLIVTPGQDMILVMSRSSAGHEARSPFQRADLAHNVGHSHHDQ